jgi:hypothetical protein
MRQSVVLRRAVLSLSLVAGCDSNPGGPTSPPASAVVEAPAPAATSPTPGSRRGAEVSVGKAPASEK